MSPERAWQPADPIVEVIAFEMRLPLPRPLRLGPVRITERHYTVVRVRASSGLEGSAYAQTRHLPVAAMIDTFLTPVLVGRDASAVGARWRDCLAATTAVGRAGAVMRAVSLVDTALWDLQGIRTGLPLCRLLGGEAASVPVTFVAGYPADGTDVDEIVHLAVWAADAGHSRVKVARAPDPAVTRAVLTGLHEALPPRVTVVLDASWVWRDAVAATTEIDTWPLQRLAWLEDPFPPELTKAYRALTAARRPVRVGAGDDLGDMAVHDALAESGAVDVLRLDVAAIGGVSAAVRVLHRAEQWGLPVSLHISAEVGAHLAASHPVVLDIETFDRRGNRYDPSHEIVEGGAHFDRGVAVLDDSPGVGWRLPDPVAPSVP
jgi:L-alanine-DL-glutamate epimerase-like enolase superfamily enzyme